MNNETITIEDSASPKEERRVTIVETKEISEVIYDGTLNDVISEITSIDTQIALLQNARRDKLALKDRLEAELNKK